ncbi:MAG TPA: glycine cleavage system aminomethyltransferase GcvT [Chthoniobacterales bacterium]
MSVGTLKTTALKDEHMRLGARMVPFGGWLMPVQYSGIVDEHQTVRHAIGMFDISHMGQFLVSGDGARDWLNAMLTNNLAKLEVRCGQYTFLLNETGGVIDDLIVYRIGEADFLLVVNASKIDEDLAWLERHRPDAIQLRNRSAEFGGIALQGPLAMEFFREWIGPEQMAPARNHIADFPFSSSTISLARTGYTGEDGFEVFFPTTVALEVWQSALKIGAQFGIKPCGLGARDTLRLEMCYPLNGSDLSPERNPLEAGLGFFVDLEKPKFIGREKLIETKRNGPSQRLVALRMNGKGPPPRPHYSIFQEGRRIGEITSGTLSPSLNIGIGMGYVSAASAKTGSVLEIEIRGQKFPAAIEKKPFYKKS